MKNWSNKVPLTVQNHKYYATRVFQLTVAGCEDFSYYSVEEGILEMVFRAW